MSVTKLLITAIVLQNEASIVKQMAWFTLRVLVRNRFAFFQFSEVTKSHPKGEDDIKFSID